MAKKISISIVELDYHPEVLRNTCRILQDLELSIQIYTSAEIWRQVALYQEELPDNIQLILLDKKNIKHFFTQGKIDIWNTDLILFNTIASHYKLFSKIDFNVPVILRIHNSNTYFQRFFANYKVIWSPFYIWKDLSHFVRNTLFKFDWYYRKKVVAKVDFFAFPGKNIQKYAIKNLIPGSVKSLWLPFAYVKKDESIKKKRESGKRRITITVLGKVDRRNRDYELVAECFSKLLPILKNKKCNYNIELVFLGKSDNNFARRIVNKLKSLECEQFSFVSFAEFVEQNVYEDYIHQTDFFILPIKIKTRHTVYCEMYGYTKISGGINDMITYQKPSLIPKQYPIDEDLQPLVGTFNSSSDLSYLINDWCTTRQFDVIDPYQHLKSYHFKEIQKIYLNTFHKIIGAANKECN